MGWGRTGGAGEASERGASQRGTRSAAEPSMTCTAPPPVNLHHSRPGMYYCESHFTGEETGTDRLIYLPTVTQPMSGGSGIQTLAVGLQTLCSQPLHLMRELWRWGSSSSETGSMKAGEGQGVDKTSAFPCCGLCLPGRRVRKSVTREALVGVGNRS